MELTTYKSAAKTDRAAVIRYIKGLGELGWEPKQHYDGESWTPIPGNFATPEEIADNLMATDEAALRLTHAERGLKAGVVFVFGNEPYEVMADCSSYEEWDADLAAVEKAINLEGV